jgi:hypothetical protein
MQITTVNAEHAEHAESVVSPRGVRATHEVARAVTRIDSDQERKSRSGRPEGLRYD